MNKGIPEGYVRWALLIEYDGTGLVGWQRQADGVSVQSSLEAAAGILFAGAQVFSATAGRTDAGVHAAGMVVQLDVPDKRVFEPQRLRDGLNFHMKPRRIGVIAARPAPDGWHARFSATARRYRYTILNRATRPILLANRAWHIKSTLDIAAMQDGANALIGRHDFTSFRATSCQAKNPIRTLEMLQISRDGDMVTIDAEGQSFLHHQIRNFAGSLVLVGRGRWTAASVREVLEARDRNRAGPTAPPEGLCLTQVRYNVALF